jgi:hypothetical protein
LGDSHRNTREGSGKTGDTLYRPKGCSSTEVWAPGRAARRDACDEKVGQTHPSAFGCPPTPPGPPRRRIHQRQFKLGDVLCHHEPAVFRTTIKAGTAKSADAKCHKVLAGSPPPGSEPSEGVKPSSSIQDAAAPPLSYLGLGMSRTELCCLVRPTWCVKKDDRWYQAFPREAVLPYASNRKRIWRCDVLR